MGYSIEGNRKDGAVTAKLLSEGINWIIDDVLSPHVTHNIYTAVCISDCGVFRNGCNGVASVLPSGEVVEAITDKVITNDGCIIPDIKIDLDRNGHVTKVTR
jgi:hypothetical protein